MSTKKTEGTTTIIDKEVLTELIQAIKTARYNLLEISRSMTSQGVRASATLEAIRDGVKVARALDPEGWEWK
jgi:hypothetical protein